jgi:hypothetical protein
MTGITKFLETSGLTEQLQSRIISVVDKHGVQALHSEGFNETLISFVSTVVLSYAISNICERHEAQTTDEMQQILNDILQEVNPEAQGMLVRVEDAEDSDRLLEMYAKQSANTLPC